MQGTKLSLGLVVRNEAFQILDCLENFKTIAGNDISEMIIVDNASSDHTVAQIQEWKKQSLPFAVLLIQSPENHMALARNSILHQASGNWVYFTDTDCRLQLDSWLNLIRILKTESAAGSQKKTAFGGGNITPPAESFVSEGLHHLSTNWLAHMGSIQAKAPQEVAKVNLLSTCNLVLCVETAKACGGFDVTYARVGEDLSLSHRLRIAGQSLFSVPNIEVIHHQDRGIKSWLRKMFLYGRAQVHVAVKYPQHFCGLRGLQFLAVLVFLGLMLAQPLVSVSVLIIYCVGLLALSKSISLGALRGVGFVFMTHAAYAIGELSAILTLPIFALKNLPTKIPALEKQ